MLLKRGSGQDQDVKKSAREVFVGGLFLCTAVLFQGKASGYLAKKPVCFSVCLKNELWPVGFRNSAFVQVSARNIPDIVVEVRSQTERLAHIISDAHGRAQGRKRGRQGVVLANGQDHFMGKSPRLEKGVSHSGVVESEHGPFCFRNGQTAKGDIPEQLILTFGDGPCNDQLSKIMKQPCNIERFLVPRGCVHSDFSAYEGACKAVLPECVYTEPLGENRIRPDRLM